ncbi:hypothetical protein DM558_02990 [Entomomonas moraniae]|uniref:Uncharacterized protein n=1 Tax=Entomomonas moraniae TaxID=2213226 RepID=A0A3Q9JLP7_9GAMM|nr:hypothetical protein [Entomomonas moraniae]AZS49809.1 hypothetical protein DM558_02990 [Entomomonas moraniae]
MKKLIAIFAITLGIIAGLTSLSVNAAQGNLTYGTWYFLASSDSIQNFNIVRNCIYTRTRWQQNYGRLQNQYYTLTVVNTSCPTVDSLNLPN